MHFAQGYRQLTQLSTNDSEAERAGNIKVEEDESQLKKKMKNTEEYRGDLFSSNRAEMANQQFVLISTSDSDDEGGVGEIKTEEDVYQLKKKRMKNMEEESKTSKEEDEEEVRENAKPISEVIKVADKGRLGKIYHYNAFEYDRIRFELEDPVLIVPKDIRQKPKFAIVKEITQDGDGNMMVTSQWFYLPEEAKKRGGRSWEVRDNRELFYSFNRDEVLATCLMHRCVVHFLPLHKQLPVCSQHPGFIVQRVYDPEEKTLRSLTDEDFEENKQHEIDLLVQKTRERLGELPDIDSEEAISADIEYHQFKNKWLFKRKSIMSPGIVSSESDDTTTETNQQYYLTAEITPGSYTGHTSEFYAILANFEALTGDTIRDKWLEKLLHGIQYVCDYSKDSKQVERLGIADELSSRENGCGTRIQYWPDAAVSAIVSLEKALHGVLSNDFRKYNQKMRQLWFNLKKNEQLAQRMVKQELKALKILNMSPNELKNGHLTTEETATRTEPAEDDEELEQMQMTDVRCSRCMEKNVGLRDIIQAGRGERYQLECTACGNTWYALSR